MVKTLKEKLLEKGWSQEEADRMHNLVHSPEKVEKHLHYKKSMNVTLYWMSLIVLTICNLVVSVVLVPVLLVLKSGFLDLVLVVLALVFGLLFNHVINSIEHIEIKHHLAAAVFIPALAIINVFIMLNVANRFAEVLQLEIKRNTLLLSLIYALAFILPYIINTAKNEILKK